MSTLVQYRGESQVGSRSTPEYRMWTQLGHWFADESGQDLVEYVLLTTAIGIAIVLGVEALGNAMNFAYSSWDGAMQDPAVVEVPDPLP